MQMTGSKVKRKSIPHYPLFTERPCRLCLFATSQRLAFWPQYKYTVVNINSKFSSVTERTVSHRIRTLSKQGKNFLIIKFIEFRMSSQLNKNNCFLVSRRNTIFIIFLREKAKLYVTKSISTKYILLVKHLCTVGGGEEPSKIEK